MNPEQQKHSTGSPNTKGILFVVAAVAVVVIILVVVMAIVRGGGASSADFVTIAQEQQEINRVAGLQGDSLTDPDARNFVTATKLTMSSDKASLLDYMKRAGLKVSEKELALGQSTATDSKLTDAQSTNTLDATLVKILQDELTQYQQSLAKAYQHTTGKNGRALLVELNDNATLLLTQSKQ